MNQGFGGYWVEQYQMISWVKSAATKKLLYFIFVGGIGFIIDGGLMILLSHVYSLDIYLSRLISFSIAVLATWVLNRTLVFKYDINPNISKRAEYGRYITVQIGGALTNLLVFTLILTTYPLMKEIPIIPFSIGALFGLVINFSGTRYWVFRGARNKEFIT